MRCGECPRARRRSHPYQIDGGTSGFLALLHRQQKHNPFHSHGETDPGRRRAAQLLNQAVITTAGGHRVLGAQSRARPLKSGATVIIEPPHHARIELERQTGFTQELFYSPEVILAGFAKKTENRRRFARELGADLFFTVQDAHGVPPHAALAVAAQFFFPLPKERQKILSITRTAGNTAERVEFQRQSVQPDHLEQISQEQEKLRIGKRIPSTQNLCIDLVKLAQPPLLGPLTAEHRTDTKELPHGLYLVKLGLDVGPNHAGRRLRPEGQRGATNGVRPRWQHGAHRVTIHKRIHLLFHDIRRLSQRATEELGLFQYRNTDLGKVVQGEYFSRLVLDKLPALDLPWQDIREAFDRGNFHSSKKKSSLT